MADDGDDYAEEESIEEPVEVEEEVTDQVEEPEGDPIEAESDDEEEQGVIVSIGEEAPPPEEEPAPQWVRKVREQNRELKREVRELREQRQAETNPVVTLGAKPSLENLDYDTEQYEKLLADWFEQKRSVDEQEAHAQRSIADQEKAWNMTLEGYGEAKAKLKVRDYDDAEEVAQNTFNVVQQGVVLQGAENPALVIYALGKNPKKASELAKIDDPVKFAFAVAKLESQLKISNRRAATQPERTVSATASSSGTVDSTLERLREEASKTGNMDKVMAYKRAQKRAAN